MRSSAGRFGRPARAMADQAGVGIELVELDVADDESVRAGFAVILAETDGRVDVLVDRKSVV